MQGIKKAVGDYQNLSLLRNKLSARGPKPFHRTYICRAFCTRMYNQFTASLTPVLRMSPARPAHSPL